FTFASLFGLLEFVQPHAFHVTVPGIEGPLSWVELMYFSFTVLTSTGFGEITPATNMARSLIVIEQVLGVMYVAFLIARLANLYGTGRRGLGSGHARYNPAPRRPGDRRQTRLPDLRAGRAGDAKPRPRRSAGGGQPGRPDLPFRRALGGL